MLNSSVSGSGVTGALNNCDTCGVVSALVARSENSAQGMRLTSLLRPSAVRFDWNSSAKRSSSGTSAIQEISIGVSSALGFAQREFRFRLRHVLMIVRRVVGSEHAMRKRAVGRASERQRLADREHLDGRPVVEGPGRREAAMHVVERRLGRVELQIEFVDADFGQQLNVVALAQRLDDFRRQPFRGHVVFAASRSAIAPSRPPGRSARAPCRAPCRARRGNSP